MREWSIFVLSWIRSNKLRWTQRQWPHCQNIIVSNDILIGKSPWNYVKTSGQHDVTIATRWRHNNTTVTLAARIRCYVQFRQCYARLQTLVWMDCGIAHRCREMDNFDFISRFKHRHFCSLSTFETKILYKNHVLPYNGVATWPRPPNGTCFLSHDNWL